MSNKKLVRRGAIAAIAVLTMLASACSSNTDVSGGDKGGSASGGSIGKDYDLKGASFTVGSKEFTESVVLGQITIAALEAAGAKVNDKTGISGTDTVRAALTSKEIDMYWEYTGTGWVNILKHTTTDLPTDLYKAVADADKANGVTWLPAAPFNDTYRIAVKADFAKKNKIESMSDAAAYINKNPSDGTLCAASEFLNRDDGLPGLEKDYGTKFKVTELDLNLIYPQVGKDCNFGEVFSTDARIVSNKLQTLKDDKKFFVDYNGALTVRTDVLDKNPDIAKIMEPISKELTDKVVTEMNSKVDNDGEKPAAVAKAFLKDHGYID
ncbi:osmoprotectant transport system substrate-binding protein [Antricoccus suffuscus]|uniref:Osmoprotectant transport system substrate-binding protein n=1 Tax=Antricoccus suffuscus TaxID=1629062 RepID=A0A2T0ZX32_9ACTN|nr:glycine betaine ABC transporter substrate-binding protein [Antricoccus suffuscus]PRZ40911.1 osmoprotectant transport system substrate-binding protein [Antricoccus suffuscus]